MKKIALAFIMATLACSASADEAKHWGYEGPGGPQEWASLSPDNFACNGKNQSPVNLTGTIHAALPAIKFHYAKGGNKVLNNGHTVQVGFEPGSTIELDGTTFTLKQYHLHAPSENQIAGHSYPLEIHLVHADKDGNLAVIAVMFKEGKHNKALDAILPVMPAEAGGSAPLAQPVSAAALLPSKRSYYRFSGSLTTPPCSEGVRWLVMKDAQQVDKQQVEMFAHVMHHPNNRPLQPLNGRVILN